MKKVFNFLILMLIVFINNVHMGYVPEHFPKDYPTKELKRDIDKSTHKYLIKLNDNNEVANDNHVNSNGQQSLFTADQALLNAHQLLPIPSQQKSYDINDDVVEMAKNRPNNKQKQQHENLEAQPYTTGLAEHQQQQQKLQQQQHNNDDVFDGYDADVEASHDTLFISRQKRQLSDFLIAPDTRWCGRGNTANGTYNHLGGASMADKCCRTHDHCKLYIPAMSNRFDLFNYRPYTLSHCNCDRRFRTCLKMANDEHANTIGKLFFNLIQTQCFVLSKEVVCQQRAKDGSCLKEHFKQKAHLRNNKKF